MFIKIQDIILSKERIVEIKKRGLSIDIITDTNKIYNVYCYTITATKNEFNKIISYFDNKELYKENDKVIVINKIEAIFKNDTIILAGGYIETIKIPKIILFDLK